MFGSRFVGSIGLLVLLVACGGGGSTSAPVTLLAPANTAPVSDAGPGQNVQLGSTVTLDGSASKDANGDILSYSWTLTSKPAGSNATLESNASIRPNLTPDLGGTYTASLVVSDGKTSSSASTVQIVVTPPTDPSFYFTGGAASAVSAGMAVTLGRAAWNLPNGDKLSYGWTLESKPVGSIAALTSINEAQASLAPDVAGTYVASLVVSDGKRQSPPAKTTIYAIDAGAYKGFVSLVNNAPCNDNTAELHLIDGKYVFAFVSGNCADGKNSARLFGLTPDQALCSRSDSVAGPQRTCTDTSLSALFDKVYWNRFVSNLGLDSTHSASPVIKPSPLPSGANPVDFTVIDHDRTSVGDYSSSVIARNEAEWPTLWQRHKGSLNASTLPPIDFGKKTVVALFYYQSNMCWTTNITSVYQLQNKLIIVNTIRPAVTPDSLCTFSGYSAGELISIDRPFDPAIQIEVQQKNVAF